MHNSVNARSRAVLFLKPGLTQEDDRVRAALEAFDAHGLHVTLQSPSSPDEAADMLRQLDGNVDRVIVAGGDGSLHMLAPALLDADLPVGILPFGTANDLARGLGIALDDVDAACALIVNGGTRSIDVGQVNDVHFFNVAHIGLAVEAKRQTDTKEKKYLGFVAYFIGAWRAFKVQRGFHATVKCDGDSRTCRVMQISVGNGPFYGGGNRITDKAAIDDGVLDLVALPRFSGGRMLALAHALRVGSIHREPRTLMLRGSEMDVQTRKTRTVTADGEVATHTPASFRVLPGALTFYTASS
ncbi:MAG TPA: lipid kinase [Oleiagrimonas sp.]|nr:lipid kinase [Oleiagrimonas sp.]